MPATEKNLRATKPKADTLSPTLVAELVQKPQNPGAAKLACYGATILISALLLFQVELIMAKILLPRFGGGPSVWSTSMLVFQLLLLGGYGYAALLCKRLTPRGQGITHIALLAISCLTIVLLTGLGRSPFWASHVGTTDGLEHPVWDITVLLLVSVGMQCLLLSATSPLLQHWIGLKPGASPYRLYALSNLGSMLGLVAYPVVVERKLALSRQGWLWIAGYGLFCAAAIFSSLFAIGENPVASNNQLPKARLKKKKQVSSAGPRLLWLVLAACSCTMLLATTNLVCQEIAPIPLLWVIPLALYLLSFIICFDHDRWYKRGVFYPLYLVLALLALRLLPIYGELPTISLIAIYNLALLAVCMICHGELARLKPEAEHLTSFYLIVSAGGALGSAAVVLVAPQIFDRFWEFQIALVGGGVLAAVATVRDRSSWFYRWRFGRALLGFSLLVLTAGTAYFTYELLYRNGDSDVLLTRNFFGVKTITREDVELQLMHGNTEHGMQYQVPEARRTPTLYYARDSGIGLFLDHYQRPPGRPLRVGVIGMGAGTLAAYGREGDYFRFYEIDPAVPQLSQGANPLFTFVEDSAAHTDVVLGDARIKMQQEISRGQVQDFDVLVIDAFSGDSVPVHLVTREAMELYLRQLHGPQSMLAVHVSSRSLNLAPVVARLAEYFHLASIEVDTTTSYWVLLSQDPKVLQRPELVDNGHPVEVSQPLRLWTDEYSSVFDVLRW